MKIKAGLLILICLLAPFVKAQIVQNNLSTLNDVSFFVNVNNPKYSNAEGSKYIFDEFVPAKINDGEKLYPIRFDAVDNIMEFKENTQEIKGLTPSREYRIVLSDGSNRTFVSKTVINESSDLQRLFLEEIHKNEKYTLYIRERIKFQPAKPAKSSYEPEVPASFKKLEDVFYVDYTGDSIDYLLQVPKNKKKAKLFFGKQGMMILKYSKKEGLKFNSTEDLIKIFNYYMEIR